MLLRAISFEILMLPENDIRIAAAIYAIRLASTDARPFPRIAGVDVQTY